jgi:excisionase family DNA binding protein
MQPLNYRINDACHRLAISRTSLYDLIARGEINVIKIGTRTLVPAAELEAFQQRLLERQEARRSAR